MDYLFFIPRIRFLNRGVLSLIATLFSRLDAADWKSVPRAPRKETEGKPRKEKRGRLKNICGPPTIHPVFYFMGQCAQPFSNLPLNDNHQDPFK